MIFLVIAAAAVGCGVAGALAGDEPPAATPVPFQPTVEIISPRNGAVQTSLAVVVKAKVTNFRLAPRHFGKDPELGMGNLRFSLNRVPDCVDPEKLQDRRGKPDRPRPPGRRLVSTSRITPARTGSSRSRSARPASTPPGPGRRSTTTTSDLASTGWLSPSPRTTARRRPSTTSPTSRSCRGRAAPAPNPAGTGKSPAPRPKASSSAAVSAFTSLCIVDRCRLTVV